MEKVFSLCSIDYSSCHLWQNEFCSLYLRIAQFLHLNLDEVHPIPYNQRKRKMKRSIAMKLIPLALMLTACCLAGAAGHAAENYTPTPGFDQRREDVTYGKMIYHTYHSQTTGRERKCYALLPPRYDAEKTYPVLYLLHGIGGDHNEWLGGKPDVVIGNLIAAGKAREMIVVIPNVRARANDTANAQDMYTPAHFAAFDNFINDLKNDLMPFIESHYKITPGRENAAIAGLSMGGREALYIGLTLSDTFGYVGAFCPAPGVLPYNVEKGLFEKAAFAPANGEDTFILINAGQSDGVVGAWPQTYSHTLRENGVNHLFYVTDGGHDFTVWKHGLYNFVSRIFPE